MEKILRVGIIGVGRRWQKRYRPALRTLRTALRISSVCDQVQERAAREAKRLGCSAAAGPTQLLERDDVDAVLLLSTQWFRLWPLEHACRLGKPVFCGCSLEWDDAYADALYRQIQERRLPVVMEMPLRSMPITARLRGLFGAELGAPRLLLCEVVRSGKTTGGYPAVRMPDLDPVADLLGGAGITLLDWCAGLLGGEPVNVSARSLPAVGFSSLFLEFAGGRGVQIVLHKQKRQRGVRERPAVRLRAQAERGWALVALPNQLSWSTRGGVQSHTLRNHRRLAAQLLEHFCGVVRGRDPPEPAFEDVYRLLGWLRLAVRSRDEGRVLTL